ncbi:lysosomal protective protein-like [Patiria miniata]|uniref:Carboxypeptidase n=1 Tax=Patiria miniata TaxID=46514 RepID=A0A914AV94_PATMI|nr:lysosomal protective protein-like [Patiria miniata]
MNCSPVLAVLVCVFCVSSAQPAADEITSLPGVSGPLSSRQYSGYLSASGTIKLHYWFVESERDPQNDPLVLWMNGGPGCSSLDGFLSELGPYQMNADGATLRANPFSWNQVANVIFLEAPAGVGFSYSDDKNYTTNDDETSKNNYLALLDFFTKFPNMASKPFFVTGESYGGVYVPTLSVRVMANASINFQGFAVGNGLLDRSLNQQTAVYYAYYHGILGEDVWAQLQKYCCTNGNCSFVTPPNAQCTQALATAQGIIFNSGLNPYDVTGNCAGGVPGTSTKRARKMFSYFFESLRMNPPQTKTMSWSFVSENVIPCINTTAETNYLNRPDVRMALHIPDVVPKWTVCSQIPYQPQYNSMHNQFIALLPKHRGLVYNGDADIMCNYLGDQKFVAALNRKMVGNRRPWIYDHQVAGFVQDYDQVSFMTVKDAGHMVPSFKPGASLQMISNFLSNKPQ